MILTGAGQIGMAIARRMCAQGLLNATYIRYLFEVAIHPLIGWNRQHHTFFDALGMVLVFLRNHP